MIDLETLSTKPNAVILSIGAVEFDIETGDIGESFFININVQDCLNHGLEVEGSTIVWWLEQSDDARSKITNSHAAMLEDALDSFTAFFKNNYQVWGNSARFDLGILHNAYDKVGKRTPWNFRKERCVRTLVSMAPEVKANHFFTGVPHDPIDDCKNQIKYCVATWNKLTYKPHGGDSTD